MPFTQKPHSGIKHLLYPPQTQISTGQTLMNVIINLQRSTYISTMSAMSSDLAWDYNLHPFTVYLFPYQVYAPK